MINLYRFILLIAPAAWVASAFVGVSYLVFWKDATGWLYVLAVALATVFRPKYADQ